MFHMYSSEKYSVKVSYVEKEIGLTSQKLKLITDSDVLPQGNRSKRLGIFGRSVLEARKMSLSSIDTAAGN
jgi:hypothetical protein